MPRNIGRIEADITLDAAGMSRGAREAEQGLDRVEEAAQRADRAAEGMRNSFSEARNTLRTFGLTAATGVGGLVLLTRQLNEVANQGRQLRTVSEQVDISVESFQRYRESFVRLGGDYNEAIENVRDFAEAIGLGAQGTGEQIRAFERLGFTARDLRRALTADFESFFVEFADRLATLSAREQITLLRDAGISRTEGIQNLAADPARLRETFERVAELGVVSGAAVDQVSDLAEAFDDVRQVFSVGLTNAAANASSALIDLARSGVDVLPGAFRQTSAALNAVLRNLGGIAGAFAVTGGIRILGQAGAAGTLGFQAIQARQLAQSAFEAARNRRETLAAGSALATTLAGTGSAFAGIVTAAGALGAGFYALLAVSELYREQQREIILNEARRTIDQIPEQGIFDISDIGRLFDPAERELFARLDELEAREAELRPTDVGQFGQASIRLRAVREDIEAVNQAIEILAQNRSTALEELGNRLAESANQERERRRIQAAEEERLSRERSRQAELAEREAERVFQVLVRELSAFSTLVTDLNITGAGTIFAPPDVGQPSRPERGQFGGVFADFTTFTGEVTEEVEEVGRRFQDLSAFQQGVILSTNDLANEFGNFITAVTDGTRALGQAARSFAREFVEVLLNNLILRPLAVNTSTLLGGLFGIGQPAQTGAVGGPFRPGALVTGEQGQEISFMTGPGFTLNPQDTERLLSGRGEITVNVDARGFTGDPVQLARAISQELEIHRAQEGDVLERSLF